MAERPNNPKEKGKSFADFLKDAPTASDVMGDDTVSLTGVVMRGDEEGQFMLQTTDGQYLELNSADVKDYSVVQETGPQKVVQLSVSAKALRAAAGAGASAINTGIADAITRKELIKDPIFDYTRKELIKDPLKDPLKEIIKDPQQDPWTIVETQGTLQEGIDPTGGLGVDPAVLGGVGGGGGGGFEGGGLTPFIMATPHHASAAAVAMQPGAGAALTFKELPGDITRKELIKEPIWDTRKEFIKDPIIDPITWVEQIGTAQEQTFDPGSVINPAAGGGGMLGGGGVLGGGGGLAQQPLAGPEAGPAAALQYTLKELIFDQTRKEMIKDPIFDTRKEIIWDTRKEITKDPLADPVTWVEQVGTAQEQVFDPGLGNVVNPAVAGGQFGPEAGGGGAGAAAATFKSIIQDRITRKELIYDTYKETIKDPIYDTRKEVFETYVEGGGTIQEGGGWDPGGGVWNLPGMMF